MSATVDTPIGALPIASATAAQAPALRELRNNLARWMLRRGIKQWNPGEMPLEWVEAMIRSTGRRYARLDCAKDNATLRAYYEREGYRLRGYETFPDIEGARDTARYEKDLAPNVPPTA